MSEHVLEYVIRSETPGGQLLQSARREFSLTIAESERRPGETVPVTAEVGIDGKLVPVTADVPLDAPDGSRITVQATFEAKPATVAEHTFRRDEGGRVIGSTVETYPRGTT